MESTMSFGIFSLAHQQSQFLEERETMRATIFFKFGKYYPFILLEYKKIGRNFELHIIVVHAFFCSCKQAPLVKKLQSLL